MAAGRYAGLEKFKDKGTGRPPRPPDRQPPPDPTRPPTPDQADRKREAFSRAIGKGRLRTQRAPRVRTIPNWNGKKPPGGLGNYNGRPLPDRPRNA